MIFKDSVQIEGKTLTIEEFINSPSFTNADKFASIVLQFLKEDVLKDLKNDWDEKIVNQFSNLPSIDDILIEDNNLYRHFLARVRIYLKNQKNVI